MKPLVGDGVVSALSLVHVPWPALHLNPNLHSMKKVLG